MRRIVLWVGILAILIVGCAENRQTNYITAYEAAVASFGSHLLAIHKVSIYPLPDQQFCVLQQWSLPDQTIQILVYSSYLFPDVMNYVALPSPSCSLGTLQLRL